MLLKNPDQILSHKSKHSDWRSEGGEETGRSSIAKNLAHTSQLILLLDGLNQNREGVRIGSEELGAHGLVKTPKGSDPTTRLSLLHSQSNFTIIILLDGAVAEREQL